MTQDRRSAFDRAVQDMKLNRLNDLETQMAGGTARRIIRDSLTASSIATQLGGSAGFWS